jgi:hypothetical protein
MHRKHLWHILQLVLPFPSFHETASRHAMGLVCNECPKCPSAKGCSADEQGNCIVWDSETRKAVHYFPLHGRPLLSVAFNSSSEWLACVSASAICCKWLAAPSPEDVLDLWLDGTKVNANSVALTKDLLDAFPHLPNTKVLPIIECQAKSNVSMNLNLQSWRQVFLQRPWVNPCKSLQMTSTKSAGLQLVSHVSIERCNRFEGTIALARITEPYNLRLICAGHIWPLPACLCCWHWRA